RTVTGVQTCALPIYADNRARRSVDVQRSANDARVRAKLTTPEAMTQNDHAVAARPAIVAGERPADRRRHAEDREERRLGQHALRSEERRVGKHGPSW